MADGTVTSAAVITIPDGPILELIAADMLQVGHRVGPIGVEAAKSLARYGPDRPDLETNPHMRDVIGFAVSRPSPMQVAMMLYCASGHASFNELGTSKMAAAPFISPGGEEMERAIPAAWAELLSAR